MKFLFVILSKILCIGSFFFDVLYIGSYIEEKCNEIELREIGKRERGEREVGERLKMSLV